jgi:hypothetical protein
MAMAEVLVKFDEPIAALGGKTYLAQAVGKEVEGGLWDGWLEFQGVEDGLEALASGRETTQPNRKNLEYWAQGLTKVYLEGALDRAISMAEPPRERAPMEPERSRFAEPASRTTTPLVSRPAAPRAILDPFQVYAQGEEILRGELRALSRDHIENIASANGVAITNPGGNRAASKEDLIEAIVGDARRASARPVRDSGEARPGL